MMMVLGLYVFTLRSVPYQELEYQRNWRHVSNARVNRRPSSQFLGPANDTLTLSGTLMPEVTGGRLSLLVLEQMAESGKAWPLIEGNGTIYGMFVIESLAQTKTAFFETGQPRRGVAVISELAGLAALSPVPAFRLTQGEQDITAPLEKRLLSLTLTDNRGFEADQLDLELDDADGLLVLPPRGTGLTLALGWRGQPLYLKGRFIVDEIQHSGAPDKLTVRARSADFRESLNVKREHSWHDTTPGEILRQIAQRHGLAISIDHLLDGEKIDHIDQTNESDGSFLMRLAFQFGAIAAVKNGHLLFIRQGQGRTASGQPLPVARLTRQSGDSHTFTLTDRNAYTGVMARWLDTREPQADTTHQAKHSAPETGDYLVGSATNLLVLNRTYASRALAERAATTQWQRLQRGVAAFTLTLAHGRPDLCTETPVTVSGFKPPIDDTPWLINKLTHTLNTDSGLTTLISLEVKVE